MKSPRSVWIAAILGFLGIGLFLPGLDDLGLTWDEPKYFDSVSQFQGWIGDLVEGPNRLDLLQPSTITERLDPAAVDFYNPHPPFYKLAMAATNKLTGRWLGPIASMRLASLLWFGLLIAGVTLVAGWRWSTTAAVGAGLAVLTLPRLVGHAHIGATDMPITFLWFVGTMGAVAYLEADRLRWLLLGSIAFGLAMATKFTGYLLLAPVLVWILLYHRTRRGLTALASTVVVGVLVAVVFNPLAWHDPVFFTLNLIHESLGRESAIPINTYYLGYRYGFAVPWHQSAVMLIVTTPIALTALLLLGLAAALARLRSEPMAAMCVLQLAFFMVLMGLPSSPNHDGVRLFLPLLPFLALLMGRGLQRLRESLTQQVRPGLLALATVTAGALFYLPPALEVYKTRPFYLSYYGEVVGGLSGAVQRGFEATYWYDAMLPGFIQEVNDAVEAGDQIAVWPSRPYFEELQRYGFLRGDIVITETLPSTYYLQLSRYSNFDAVQWAVYRHIEPVVAVVHDGVELAGLYRWSDSEQPALDQEHQP